MLDRGSIAPPDVTEVSALGGWPGISGEGLSLAERRGLAIVELAAFGRGKDWRHALSSLLGIDLPGNGLANEAKPVCALSVGPGRWLILGPDAAVAALPQIPDDLAAVTDLTGGRAILTLSGARAAPTLMKGTAIDLDPAVFTPGSVVATGLARMPAIIWRREAGYDVIVPRSYAVSMLEWLLEAGGLAAG
jgi:heterotetrameric sarcosine oxidase gamma subunit